MAFGRHLAGQCEALKKGLGCKLQPPAAYPKAQDTFASMSYGLNSELYQFAALKDVFTYLRGGKGLRVPAEWQHLVPRAFPSAEGTSSG